MGSKKRSARAKQVADFMANLGDTDDAFARESERVVQQEQQHESALRRKALRVEKALFRPPPTPKRPSLLRRPWNDRGWRCYSLPLLRRLAPHLEAPNEGRLPISCHRERSRLTRERVSIRATSPEGYGYRQRRHDRTAFVLCRIVEEEEAGESRGG